MRQIRLFAVITFVFLFSALAEAQATRTWVSGVGDDVNPCSRTAPCKTFAGAISKTAVNGEINCLDPAGYGAVTITKSITIDCEDTQGSILGAGTNGVIINITAETDTKKAVKLRGLSINGAATGINGIRLVSAASYLSVEDMVIDGVTQSGISIESNSSVMVRNTSIRAASYGIKVVPASGSADVTVAGSSISFTGTGISAGENSTVRMTRNTITLNKIGITAVKGASIVSFKDNAIDGNGINGAPTSTAIQQ